jgi:hypothetical protein
MDLKFHKADKLPENVLDWAFTLCKANMEDFYNTSWGWNDTTKREELSAPEARLLLAYLKVSLSAHQQYALLNIELASCLHAQNFCFSSKQESSVH